VAFAENIFNDYQVLVKEVPDAINTYLFFEYIPYKKVISVSQTATAFASRGAYSNMLFSPVWTDIANDTACREWTRKMAKKAKAELKRRIKEESTDNETGTSVGEYANYDSK